MIGDFRTGDFPMPFYPNTSPYYPNTSPGYEPQPQSIGHYFSGFDGQRIDDLIKAINRLAEAMEAKK